MVSLVGMIRDFFGKNYYGREVAKGLLTNPLLANNPLFYRLHLKRVRQRVARENFPPELVLVETTNACNARCVMCARNVMTRPVGMMSEQTFERAIEECAANAVKGVTLQFMGEPLLDKHLHERLALAKSRGLETTFFTNAALLDETIARQLITDANLDLLQVSFDGFSKQVYESIRVGLSFDRVYQNLARFLELRTQLGAKLPRVLVTFANIAQNAAEKDDFYRCWSARADEVLIANGRNWAGQVQVEGTGRFVSRELRRVPCIRPWTQFVILYNGDVTVCCEDSDAKLVVGNINESSMREIWWGDKLLAIRRAHLQGRQDELPLCRQCSFYSVWW